MTKNLVHRVLLVLLWVRSNLSKFDSTLISKPDPAAIDAFRFLTQDGDLRLRTPSPDPDYSPSSNRNDYENIRNELRAGEESLKDYSLNNFGSWKSTNYTEGLIRLLAGHNPHCRLAETQTTVETNCDNPDFFANHTGLHSVIESTDPSCLPKQDSNEASTDSDAAAAAYSDECSDSPPELLLEALISELDRREVLLERSVESISYVSTDFVVTAL